MESFRMFQTVSAAAMLLYRCDRSDRSKRCHRSNRCDRPKWPDRPDGNNGSHRSNWPHRAQRSDRPKRCHRSDGAQRGDSGISGCTTPARLLLYYNDFCFKNIIYLFQQKILKKQLTTKDNVVLYNQKLLKQEYKEF